MHTGWIYRVLIALTVLAPCATARAQAARVEQRGDVVVGVDASGEALWKIRHKFDDEGGSFANLRFEPVVDGRRAYYATRADLLTVDLDAGQIVERRRFPGYIDAMERADDGYTLTLLARADAEDPAVDVRYRPGEPMPGRGPFEPILAYAAKQDADVVAGRPEKTELVELDAQQAGAALERLGAQEARDATNLFLPIYRGRILQGQDEAAKAQAAFERALAIDDAPWTDAMYASSLLAKYGADAVSRKLFERAREKMLAHGVRPERLNGLVFQVVLTHPLSDAIGEALADGDVDRVDRLSERIATIFPHAEMAPNVWRQLAGWMDEHDRDDLAEKWRAHAAEAATAPLATFNHQSGRQVDLALDFMVAILMALLLIPVAIGLRKTERRSKRGVPFPNINVWDALGIAVMAAVCVHLTQFAQTRVVAIGTVAAAPLESFEDAYASPKFVDWVDELATSPGRDAWLAYAQDEQHALEEGARAEGPAPDEQLLVDAIIADAAVTSDDDATIQQAPTTFPLRRFFADVSPVWMALSFGSMVLCALLLGMLIQNFAPRLARYFRILIPGSAKLTGPFAVPICAAFFAASFAFLFDLDRLLTTIATPAFGKYYGLDALEYPEPSYAWAFAAFFGALGLHALTTWWEQRGEDRGRVELVDVEHM